VRRRPAARRRVAGTRGPRDGTHPEPRQHAPRSLPGWASSPATRPWPGRSDASVRPRIHREQKGIPTAADSRGGEVHRGDDDRPRIAGAVPMASEPAARGLPGVGATAVPHRAHASTSPAATEPC